ncbi:uncharacterized protein LOC142893440 isoform X2 [Nelusetta ayraudi]|uniref:uncharacterized protein LOC142893440 isoform X2 n=1 Tax=Nelusetta ayraudi TaxID=303726 RepID=UPI003F725B14
MTTIVPSLFFVIVNIIFVTAESSSGQSLAPRDVSLEWINDFKPQLSWKPPLHLPGDCCFRVSVQATRYNEIDLCPNESNFSGLYFTKESSLNMSVQTICNNMMSEPVIKTNMYPELVSALDCDIISTNQIRCSWTPLPGAPESQFFYRWVQFPTTNLLPCPHLHNDGKLIVCDIQTPVANNIEVLFKGTVDGKPVRNTFDKSLFVKPLVTKWSVTKTDRKFNISWVCPDIPKPHRREFVVIYTECAKPKPSGIIKSLHIEIDRLPNCRYCFAIETHVYPKEARTEEECFDADLDLDVFVLAAVIVPLACAGLAVLALVCCIRNKDYIFPPIPKPRDLLSDISDNNNKMQFGNLYFPLEVEELFKITLVMDPPIDALES